MKKFFLLFLLLVAVSTAMFAQSGKAKTDSAKQQTYTCTMHPEIKSDKPGICPKCGMALVPAKKMKTTLYTCTMHPEIVSEQPGKCPKCGMTLVEKMGGHRMDSSKHQMPM